MGNHQNAILLVKNQEMPFVMLNVKNLIVKLNALIRLVKLKTALNVSPSVNNLTVLLIVKHLNQNVKPSVKNQDVTGNATNLNALNQNVNWFVKILPVNLKLNVVHVLPVLSELLFLCSKKLE